MFAIALPVRFQKQACLVPKLQSLAPKVGYITDPSCNDHGPLKYLKPHVEAGISVIQRTVKHLCRFFIGISRVFALGLYFLCIALRPKAAIISPLLLYPTWDSCAFLRRG